MSRCITLGCKGKAKDTFCLKCRTKLSVFTRAKIYVKLERENFKKYGRFT